MAFKIKLYKAVILSLVCRSHPGKKLLSDKSCAESGGFVFEIIVCNLDFHQIGKSSGGGSDIFLEANI